MSLAPLEPLEPALVPAIAPATTAFTRLARSDLPPAPEFCKKSNNQRIVNGCSLIIVNY